MMMTDVVEVQRVREKANKQKALWVRCMNLAVSEDLKPWQFAAFGEALRVIANAYAMTCSDLRQLEEEK